MSPDNRPALLQFAATILDLIVNLAPFSVAVRVDSDPTEHAEAWSYLGRQWILLEVVGTTILLCNGLPLLASIFYSGMGCIVLIAILAFIGFFIPVLFD